MPISSRVRLARCSVRCCRSCRRRGRSHRSVARCESGTPRADRAGRESRDRASGRAPRGATPRARCAAAGAKRSRPWNVREIDPSAYSGLASSRASAMPASSAAGSRSPLSGPTKRRPVVCPASVERPTRAAYTGVDHRQAHARPACRSSVLASTRAPCVTAGVGGIPTGDVDHWCVPGCDLLRSRRGTSRRSRRVSPKSVRKQMTTGRRPALRRRPSARSGGLRRAAASRRSSVAASATIAQTCLAGRPGWSRARSRRSASPAVNAA